ncbi:MAG: hypothetical protein H0W61_01735 [Bacteroidetes bacterium]|nr:hypothetical protein [Bacteroidota bacterium]
MAEKKEHKRLTIAELRKCKGFENYSDEQAEATIKSLEKLSILFYGLYMKQKQKVQKQSLIKAANKKGGTNERKAESGKRDAA